jgi:hypothetical protein
VQAKQENPKTGALGTISAFLIGMIPQVDPAIQTTVIFWFQVGAFTISIVVGILTIISYCRKMKREKMRERE